MKHVAIDDEHKAALEQLARVNGKSETDVVHAAIDAYLETERSSPGTSAGGGPTCYELAEKAGLVGYIDGLPTELSTNPKYMEGFGRDR